MKFSAILLFILNVVVFKCESTPVNVVEDSVMPQLDCVNGFTKIGFNCYSFQTSRLAWINAQDWCSGIDADLAHPPDSHENDLLKNYVALHYSGVVDWWIGGTDQIKEGDWVWGHNGNYLQYDDWESARPLSSTSYNCMEYYEYQGEFHWYDFTCSTTYSFICQQRLTA